MTEPAEKSAPRVGPPPSKSTPREALEAALEVGVSAIPIVGGPLATSLALAVGFQYNRRLGAWLEDVAEAVNRLADQVEGLWLEDLANDDVFVDTPVHLHLLQLLDDAGSYFDGCKIARPELSKGGRIHLVQAAIPALTADADWINVVDRDLANAGNEPRWTQHHDDRRRHVAVRQHATRQEASQVHH